MPTRRGHSVPWTLAQSTPTNDRLCSLLSALLLRRPAPPLENRLPWQLFDPKQGRRNIFLLVLSDNQSAWPDDDFYPALQSAIQPSSFWFCGEMRLGENDNFCRKWLRFLSSINHKTTDIYVITGSLVLLNQLAQQLTTDHPLGVKIKGILSVLPHHHRLGSLDPPTISATAASTTGVPHIPDGVFHWIIQTNSPVGSTQSALAVANHGQTLCLNLPISSGPDTSWFVRAVLWFAYAVQIIDSTTRPVEPKFLPRARL